MLVVYGKVLSRQKSIGILPLDGTETWSGGDSH